MIKKAIAIAIFIGFLGNAQAMRQNNIPRVSKPIGNHVYEYLFQVCLGGNLPNIKRCVEGTGVDVNIADENGCAALHYLCANNYLSEVVIAEAVHYLVSKGANFNMRDNYGNKPMFYLGKDLMSGEIVNPYFNRNAFLQALTALNKSTK